MAHEGIITGITSNLRQKVHRQERGGKSGLFLRPGKGDRYVQGGSRTKGE